MARFHDVKRLYDGVMGHLTLPARSASLTGLCLLAACTTTACSKTAAELFISPEQENMLGAQIKLELEKGAEGMPPIRYLQDPELRGYILGLAEKVVALGRMQKPEFSWKVEVIDDPTQVNAFATPGGYLYVFTGLLRAAENEAEVVGVMGHEVGHVLARHYAQRLVQTYTLQGLIAIALGENPNALADLGASVLAQGYLLSHSRDAETEADDYGARLASQAMFDPTGLATFFVKLEMEQGQVPSIFKYLSGHPPPGDREKHIREFITREKLTIGVLNREKFQEMRSKLPAGLPTMGTDGGTDARDAR
jgi:beta-barrel assembly-enhancing protease